MFAQRYMPSCVGNGFVTWQSEEAAQDIRHEGAVAVFLFLISSVSKIFDMQPRELHLLQRYGPVTPALSASGDASTLAYTSHPALWLSFARAAVSTSNAIVRACFVSFPLKSDIWVMSATRMTL